MDAGWIRGLLVVRFGGGRYVCQAGRVGVALKLSPDILYGIGGPLLCGIR